MRRLLLAAVLASAAACGGRAASGPAWPKSAGTEIDPDPDAEDGGESLEPRSADAVAAVETSSGATPEPAPTDAPPTPPVIDAKPDQPATPDAPAKPPEGEPTFEEIIIEVTPTP